MLASFLAWAPHAPDALGSLCRLAAGPGGPSVQVFGQFLGSETQLKAALATLGPPATKLTTGTASWLDLVRRWAGCLGHTLPSCSAPGTQAFVGASDYIAKIPTAAQLTKFRTAIESRGAASGALLIDSYGGALNRVAPAATAFVHRNVLSSIQYFAAGDPTSARAWVNSSRASLKPAVNGAGVRQLHRPGARELAAGLLRRRTCRGCARSSASTTRTTSSTSRRASVRKRPVRTGRLL